MAVVDLRQAGLTGVNTKTTVVIAIKTRGVPVGVAGTPPTLLRCATRIFSIRVYLVQRQVAAALPKVIIALAKSN